MFSYIGYVYYIHAHIHMYIHTYIYTYIHAYVLTYAYKAKKITRYMS